MHEPRMFTIHRTGSQGQTARRNTLKLSHAQRHTVRNVNIYKMFSVFYAARSKETTLLGGTGGTYKGRVGTSRQEERERGWGVEKERLYSLGYLRGTQFQKSILSRVFFCTQE